jgi:hypothetical protein
MTLTIVQAIILALNPVVTLWWMAALGISFAGGTSQAVRGKCFTQAVGLIPVSLLGWAVLFGLIEVAP